MRRPPWVASTPMARAWPKMILRLKWYRLAAEQGHAHAQNSLGGMYSSGQGVLKDDAEAVKWYLWAANQGYANEQFRLGEIYAKGGEDWASPACPPTILRHMPGTTLPRHKATETPPSHEIACA